MGIRSCSLCTRISEHRSKIRRNDRKNPVADHLSQWKTQYLFYERCRQGEAPSRGGEHEKREPYWTYSTLLILCPHGLNEDFDIRLFFVKLILICFCLFLPLRVAWSPFYCHLTDDRFGLSQFGFLCVTRPCHVHEPEQICRSPPIHQMPSDFPASPHHLILPCQHTCLSIPPNHTPVFIPVHLH